MGIGTGLGVAGIASAGIGAAGSGIAASTQAGAAENAQQLQAQEAQQALQFQEQEWNQQQKNLAPFLQTGTNATLNLQQLLNPNAAPGPTTSTSIGGENYNLQTGGGNLLTPWNSEFQAPTAASAEATPGYQFTLQQGENALQDSAAASGGLLTTGTAKGLEGYAGGLASQTYQQTYNNAIQQYQQAYNQFQQNQSNTFNRLAGVSGAGQQVATTLGNQGQGAASGVSNINLTTGALQGQDIMNAGTATASGYAGGANALTGGIGSIAGALTLQQLLAGAQGNTGINSSIPGFG